MYITLSRFLRLHQAKLHPPHPPPPHPKKKKKKTNSNEFQRRNYNV